ncbi:MAG TPA: DUF1553 domain-containing protein, partial [Planctomycetota bacterium]|nr:DUF1553 domain-containing protein [Planctomycetota bacterium]
MQMLDDGSVLVRGDLPNADAYEVDLELDPRTLGERVTAIRLEVLPHESLPDRGPGRAPLFSRGDFLLSEIEASVLGSGNGNENESGNESANANARPLALRSATTDFAGAGRAAEHTLDGRLDTGWSIQGATGRPHRIVWELAEPLELENALRIRVVIEQLYIHQMTIGRFRFAATSAPTPVVASPHPHEVERALANVERDAADLALLEERFLDVAPELAAMNAEIAKRERSMPRFPTTLVLEERTLDPRTTRLRHRGEFLQPRQPVEPGVPEFLHPLPDGAPRNRLGLARWIVDERNPLFARVIANRVWQAFFGRGIVETTGDFGIRGALPSHPELLDHLAIELRESGYGFKSLLRTIVLSATYRQSSHATPELLSRDPENRLFARGPRFRLPAEMIRDGALLAAGLLDERIGGPSVYPPLPEGVADLAWGGYRWPTSKGADRYRRSLYTFAKRTVPHPVYTVFDAPPGDVCEVRRGRSNTPLQALTLLSDAIYVEAARALAARVLEDSGPHATVEERVTRLFILVYGRSPDREELELIEAWGERQI